MNYSFVAREEDVDYPRVLREAPRGTRFILVETRTRTNQVKQNVLMVSRETLKNEKIQGARLGGHKISANWGYDDDPNNPGTPLHSYRYYCFQGPVPGRVMRQIEQLKRDLNPKNTKVFVKLF